MIEGRGIKASYDGKTVLDNLNFDFPSGRVTCVMGPSGCGKTTLLNVCMGIIKPDAGSIIGIPKKKAAVFQDDRLLDTLTTFLNARIAVDKRYSLGDVSEHLSLLGLSDSLNKPASSLSGGMKKRLGIARAVLSSPEILFLDEPFNGIDDKWKCVSVEYIKKFCSGATIVMVTHSADEAELMCAEKFFMAGG